MSFRACRCCISSTILSAFPSKPATVPDKRKESDRGKPFLKACAALQGNRWQHMVTLLNLLQDIKDRCKYTVRSCSCTKPIFDA